MTTVTLGKTGLTVQKNGFGALPIQRISRDDAAHLLQKALDAGVNFFDTARAYTDSEEKIGYALSHRRAEFVLATKTEAVTVADFWSDLEQSLRLLQTDHVDIYQFHNTPFCPKPGDGTGLYEAMGEAVRQGKVLHPGITNHRLAVAHEAIDSGLYETLQFPFCYLSTDKDLAVMESAVAHDMGFIAMKALSGGLIQNSAAAYAWQAQYPGVVPIWGVQRESELDQFLSYIDAPPALTPELQAVIDRDRKQLLGDFCRGCGYCLPCPVGIQINDCARMSLMIRRAPSPALLTPETQAQMKKIEDCLHCNQCSAKCPYDLDTPRLLADNYKDYQEILAGKPL